MKALVALEDGTIFEGESFTGPGEAFGEIVFNTGMTGYQEILTDPSYKGQIVSMTYPLIGNYGINQEDMESARIQPEAFLVKEYNAIPSNYRSISTLAAFLQEHPGYQAARRSGSPRCLRSLILRPRRRRRPDRSGPAH